MLVSNIVRKRLPMGVICIISMEFIILTAFRGVGDVRKLMMTRIQGIKNTDIWCVLWVLILTHLRAGDISSDNAGM